MYNQEWLSLAVAETGAVGQHAYMWVGAMNLGGSWQWVETGDPVDNGVM